MAYEPDDLLPSLESLPVSGVELSSWIEDPAAWSTCTIGGVKIPGLSIVDGKGFDNRVDRQKIPGSNGQRLVHVGYDPADFTIRTRVWTKEQLNSYLAVVTVVRPKKKGTPPTPVSVDHPTLTLWGVTSCLVLSGSMPKANQDESPQWYTIELRCIEFVPAGSGTTATASYDVANLGPGAVGEKVEQLKAQQSPAAQNRSPNTSYPDAADNNGTASFQPPSPPEEPNQSGP